MFKWFGKVNFSPFTKVTDFAQYLKDGRLMGSRCKECGAESFPPRADCENCMSGDFEFFEMTGKCTLHTFTTIVAAPTGFEDVTPYTVGVVDLEEGGRALAWFGETIAEKEIEIGMKLQVVPQIFAELEDIKVYYSLEKPGTTWAKTDSAM
ncbi:MAG: Zn-ribbon domain-containing OB-fold protein [Candidatus Aminicenantes bacterium]|nr:Zn-ribbon domain-containing OB-fold protein [Candidatus Aminicenantes bacterium]